MSLQAVIPHLDRQRRQRPGERSQGIWARRDGCSRFPGPNGRRWKVGLIVSQATPSGGAFVGGLGSLTLLIYIAAGAVSLYQPPIVAALSAISVLLPSPIQSWDTPGLHWGLIVAIGIVSVIVYGARRNTTSQIALSQAQSEIRILGAEQERMRIGRDLHDLLGHALTTVAVKAELAQRLTPLEPDRAAAEMAEVGALARQSLADVRATVAGYRDVSLLTELATAREVLRAAGIDAELPAAVEAVPGDRRELFGWVLREGVTNVVRHSRADRVTVRFLETGIEIVDDGIGADAAMGSGLRGLTERVAAAGGHLTAGPLQRGGWRLAIGDWQYSCDHRATRRRPAPRTRRAGRPPHPGT